MKFRDLGEFEFIAKIDREMINRPEGVVKGIGDDAAVFEAPEGQLMILTTDMLIEGVHFLRDTLTPYQLGRKSLAVNLSDAAAMGARPLDAFISLAVPLDLDVEYGEEIYRGLRAIAGEYGVNLLGGDTTRSKDAVVINVALTGAVPGDEVVYRSGAKPGQAIYTTCFLGDSAAGLHMILNAGPKTSTATEKFLYDAHFDPKPHVAQGRFLAENGFASAMLDISDGLASDLRHICKASKVGAVIREDGLPISTELKVYAEQAGIDALDLALFGGEDYGLLLTVPEPKAAELERSFMERFEYAIARIGETTAEQQMVFMYRDGRKKDLGPGGWDSFRTDHTPK